MSCWGDNSFGQLGAGTNTSLATSELAITSATQVVAGSDHTCILDAAHQVQCWGRNSAGAIGDGTTIDRSVPTPVIAGDVQRIEAGAFHTCAVRTDGSLACWGANAYGQLGTGDVVDHLQPTDVPLAGAVADVAAGLAHTCAGRDDGSVSCWGARQLGELGDGWSMPPGAVHVPMPGTVTTFAVGDDHVCAAVGTSNEVYCWGAVVQDRGARLGDDRAVAAHAVRRPSAGDRGRREIRGPRRELCRIRLRARVLARARRHRGGACRRPRPTGATPRSPCSTRSRSRSRSLPPAPHGVGPRQAADGRSMRSPACCCESMVLNHLPSTCTTSYALRCAASARRRTSTCA